MQDYHPGFQKRSKVGSMKKLGLICLALIAAIGSIGVAYAGWSQSLGIGGNVTTGSWSQTLTLTPLQDSYIDSNHAATNYGSTGSLIVYTSGTKRSRALVRFDLSTLAGKTIDSATLKLYVTAGSNNVVPNRITASWNETQVTWNRRTSTVNWTKAGGDYNSAGAGVNTVSGWTSWDLTTDVRAFVSGTTFYGWIMTSNGAGNPSVTFSSREGSNPPQLIVTYH
jgi:acid phosphatase type 7